MQVTHHAGVDSLPVWSPDGTRLAFDSPRNGHYQICVVPAAGGAETALTADTARNVQPAWSPDGSAIAFASNRSGSFDVYVYTLASGNVRRLTTDSAAEYQPAWSPDGRRILFARATAAGQTIDVMPAAGGPATALTGVRGNELPSWQAVAPTAVTGVSPAQGATAGATSVNDHRQELRRRRDGDVRLGRGDGRRRRVVHRDHRHEPGGLGHGRRRRHHVARIVGRLAGRPVHLPVGGATRSEASTWLTPAARSAACAAEPTTT